MKDNKQHLQDLAEIRSMMERSSRFLSLSGLSGIFAGIYALIGACLANRLFGERTREIFLEPYLLLKGEIQTLEDFRLHFILIPFTILATALLTGYFFTWRNAQKHNQKIWTKTSWLMLVNLFIPLAAGGVFCLIMMHHGVYFLLSSATLIFYGLALINASKYTLDEIRYLGFSEIVIGLLAAFFVNNGLLFWAIGFGVLHMVYGGVMWWKYERK
jgi:hypothetical protein